jgi:hypothetical protein
MDISSFILGVCSVVVVGCLAVTVYSLIKIKKKIKEIDNKLQDVEHIIGALGKEAFSGLENNRDEMRSSIDEVYRNMDSRLDKIISKIKMLEADVYHRKQKEPIVPPGPLVPNDIPVYPGYDYDKIRWTDNTSNQ